MTLRSLPLMRHLRQLACRCHGVVTLEYALVLPMVMAFVMGTLDLSLYYYSDGMLMQGVQKAARCLRTGQLRTNASKTDFTTVVCTGADSRIDCSKLVFDVASFTTPSDFATAFQAGTAWPDPIYDADGNVTNYDYKPADNQSIVTMRVILNYSFVTPGMEYFLGRSTEVVPIDHSLVVKVEPWDDYDDGSSLEDCL